MTAIAHTFTPGAIVAAKWGHEQTNVDFYVVVSASAKMAKLQRIGSTEEVDAQTMVGRAMPNAAVRKGEPITRKVLASAIDGENFVMVNGYTVARPWNGKAQEITTYA